jgi:hypothetical protein
MTLGEVCFQLAFRKQILAPELGRPDLYGQAFEGALSAHKIHLSAAIRSVGAAELGTRGQRHVLIANMVQAITEARDELPAWFMVEIAPRVEAWLDELNTNIDVGDNPLAAQQILPPFFDALRLPDAAERKDRLAQRCIHILMKGKRYLPALTILESLPEPKPKLAAECYEASGQFAKAGALYLQLDDREKALRCFRSVPDFQSSLALVRQLETHPARASLEWLAELETLLARRPDNFNRAMTPPEKKLLEAMLERGLGVQRKPPAAKKAPAIRKSAPAARKAALPRKPVIKRLPRRRFEDDDPF